MAPLLRSKWQQVANCPQATSTLLLTTSANLLLFVCSFRSLFFAFAVEKSQLNATLTTSVGSLSRSLPYHSSNWCKCSGWLMTIRAAAGAPVSIVHSAEREKRKWEKPVAYVPVYHQYTSSSHVPIDSWEDLRGEKWEAKKRDERWECIEINVYTLHSVHSEKKKRWASGQRWRKRKEIYTKEDDAHHHHRQRCYQSLLLSFLDSALFRRFFFLCVRFIFHLTQLFRAQHNTTSYSEGNDWCAASIDDECCHYSTTSRAVVATSETKR